MVGKLPLGTTPFLRSRQLCSYTRLSKLFMEPEGSLPSSKELTTGPYPEPHESILYHPILLVFLCDLSSHLSLDLSSGLFPCGFPIIPYVHSCSYDCYLPSPSHPSWCDYEVMSIISWTNAAVCSKINFGPTGYHRPRSSPFTCVYTVPSASVIFKCILEVVFCEGVHHRLRFFLDYLNYVKMAALKFYLRSGKQRKVAGCQVTWLGCVGDVTLFLVKNSLVLKGSVRRCVVMMKYLVLLSPKFGVKSSHIFRQSP
jgi:hypothetical protein